MRATRAASIASSFGTLIRSVLQGASSTGFQLGHPHLFLATHLCNIATHLSIQTTLKTSFHEGTESISWSRSYHENTADPMTKDIICLVAPLVRSPWILSKNSKSGAGLFLHPSLFSLLFTILIPFPPPSQHKSPPPAFSLSFSLFV